MKIHHLHSWDLTTQEAIALQKQLAMDIRRLNEECESKKARIRGAS